MLNLNSCPNKKFGEIVSSPERNNVDITIFHSFSNHHLLQSVLSIQKNHLHQNANPEHFFRIVAFIPAISFLKKQC
jgi:hypothetical protein